VADLDHEAGGTGDVEAEHAVVVVHPEAVRDDKARRPRPVEGGAHVVAAVRFDHQVVQFLGQVERRLGQGQGVVARVAMVEAHLELDALGDLHLQPVRLGHPEPVGDEGVGLVEGGGGEHDVAEPDAVGEEPARHQLRCVRRGGVLEAGDQLDRDPPRRHRPSEAPDPPSRTLVVAARLGAEAGDVEASDEGVEGGVVAGVQADEGTVVGRAGLDDHALGLVVVTPCRRPGRPRLTGDEADDVAEERGQRGRVGHLDTQVGELQLVLHHGSFRSAPKSSEITTSACASTT
jgi:hypothetical protein